MFEVYPPVNCPNWYGCRTSHKKCRLCMVMFSLESVFNIISHNNQRGKHGQCLTCYTLRFCSLFAHGITQEEIHKLISSFSYSISYSYITCNIYIYSYSISYSYSYSDVIFIVLEHRKSWLVTLWLKQATRSLYFSTCLPSHAGSSSKQQRCPAVGAASWSNCIHKHFKLPILKGFVLAITAIMCLGIYREHRYPELLVSMLLMLLVFVWFKRYVWSDSFHSLNWKRPSQHPKFQHFRIVGILKEKST